MFVQSRFGNVGLVQVVIVTRVWIVVRTFVLAGATRRILLVRSPYIVSVLLATPLIGNVGKFADNRRGPYLPRRQISVPNPTSLKKVDLPELVLFPQTPYGPWPWTPPFEGTYNNRPYYSTP